MLPGSPAGKEAAEKRSAALLEGRTQPHEPGEDANHRDASPKGRGRNTAMWAVATFPHPDLFLDSAQNATREYQSSRSSSVFVCLPLLGACTGSVPTTQVVVIVTAASRRIICAS